jgi:PAS domain S-box-containing protein
MAASPLSTEVFFFNLSLDLLSVIGVDGCFKRVNPAFSKTLGYSEADFLGQPFANFLHPNDHGATMAALEQVKTGSPILNFENRYRTQGGDYRWLEWTAAPHLDQGVIYCIARDVTEQKQAAAALKVSDERWQLALQGSNDGIWDWNVQTNEVFLSPRWKSMLGYEDHEISNHLDEWAQRVHPEDLGWVMQAIQDHFDRKTPFYSAEHRILCKDGTYKWILDRGQATWNDLGQVVRMTGAHTDVTERRHLEAELKTANETLEQRVADRTAALERAMGHLRDSELRFRQAVDHLPDVFVIYDAQRRIEFINTAGLTLTGRPLEDFLGYTDEEIHPPAVTAAYLPLLKQAVATKRYQTGECTITLPGQDPYTIVVQYVPLLDEQGEINQILGITHNITERKQIEEHSHRNAQQLRRILDSLFSFVGVMTPDGILIEANRTALEAACLRSEDVLGKPFEEAYWWSYSPVVQAQLRDAIAQAAVGAQVRYDVAVRVGEDRLITIDFTLGPIFNSSGQVEYLIPSGIDITERKRAEEALLASQRQIQQQLAEIESIYHSAPIGLNVLDTDLRFVRINQQLAEINGLPVEAHLGRTVRELLPNLADTAEALLLPILESGEPLLDVEIRGETPAQPGVERVWRESFLPLKDGDRVIGINTVCEEITDRIRVEAALRESEERYRRLFETMEDGFAVIEMLFDDHNRPLDYRFMEVNPIFERHTGLHAAVGKTARQLVPNLEDFWFETYGQVALTGESIRFDHGVEALNRWFEVYAFSIGQLEERKVAVLFKDISDRKRSEVALRDSEDRLRMAIASAQLGTWDWNLLTDELQWDANCRAMFGLAPDEVVTTDLFFAYLHPEDRDRLKGLVTETLEPASGGAYDIQCRVLSFQAKEYRWLRSKGQVYYDSSGKPLRFSGTALDITEQKAVEAQRERLLKQEQAAREAAEQANRMKDEFLAMLSHELRTPLNPILGWAKLLQAPHVGADKLQKGLSAIERNAQQQAQLVEDLLDISRIVRGSMTLNATTIDLSEPITRAFDTVQLTAEAKAVQLEVLINPRVGPVRGDLHRLQQVFWNLLANAIKFTPAGGRVTLQLRQVERQAQIQVQDNGKGIDPQFLPHVFELFKQQDSSMTRSFGGLGLGLAIARQVVEAHGGTITAASPGEGKGATFTVQLPLIATPTPTSPKAPVMPPLRFDHLRVLVVDDEIDSLTLLQMILEQAGAVVQTVSSPAMALQTLTQATFDLLISDIGMPEVDGYALIRQVRDLPHPHNRDLPAIALTAYAGEDNQHRMLAAGFQAHLAKPITPQSLIAQVAALVTP